MRTKGFVICFLLGIIYISCDDTISRIGLGIQPEEDKIVVFDTTVFIDAKTIEVDSVYAKTIKGFLGEIYDPSYGVIKSSYICQYYPSVGFTDFDSIVDNKIDSVRLNITYASYFGDSLAPMEVTVYPVIKALGNHYYTNTNPENFCDMNNPMAKYGYTARNLNIVDDILQQNGWIYYLSIPLPVEFGQEYFDRVKRGELTTTAEFLNFFPGTYLSTTYGTGSLLPIESTDIVLYYTRKITLENTDGGDSSAVRVSNAIFSVTNEIIQLNSFKNKNPDFLLEDNEEKTYIKSPAGVFTELTIPIREIAKGIGKKKFSSVKLSLNAYPKDEWEYSFSFPGTWYSGSSSTSSGFTSKLLLIEPDSVASFFEKKMVANGQTSYATQFNSSSFSYEFSNIANVVQNAIDKAPEKDLKLWLIPVLTSWVTQSSTYTQSINIDYMTSHYLYPSGVTLKKGGDNLKVRVIATDMKYNE